MNKFLSIVMAIISMASGIGLVIFVLLNYSNDNGVIVLSISFVVTMLLWRSMDKENENNGNNSSPVKKQ